MNCRYLLPILVAAFLLPASLLPATASAQEPVPVDLSVGLKGGAMMQAATEVPDLDNEQRSRFNAPDDDSGFFPGFGVGPAFGLALEARAWNVVGLETGFVYSLDHATGWLDKSVNNDDKGRIFADQQTSALHIPLLLKVNAPTTMIKPFFGFGFEFVLQQTSSLDYRSDRENPDDPTIDAYENLYEGRNTIEPSNYTLLQLTAGVDIDLGNIRIPIEFRGGYNLGYDDSFEARVNPGQRDDGTWEFEYNGEYIAHFGVFVGVMYDWELNL